MGRGVSKELQHHPLSPNSFILHSAFPHIALPLIRHNAALCIKGAVVVLLLMQICLKKKKKEYVKHAKKIMIYTAVSAQVHYVAKKTCSERFGKRRVVMVCLVVSTLPSAQ